MLLANRSGASTRAAPQLYPHQWSWDAAFIAIGLARLDVARACLELDSLFRGQWADGMQPHIVFDPASTDYFPGPDRWACSELTDRAPTVPRTSGICQPPVHAIAAQRILAAADASGSPATREATSSWLTRFYPKLLAWHRFLARDRRDPGTGLLTIYHGWESGLDNSPRWDAPYSGVKVGPGLPPYRRRDTSHVAEAGQRPSEVEYDRYLWLVEEAKSARYDPAAMRRTSSFAVGDVLFTAIFAAASEVLAELSGRLGAGDDQELRRDAAAARAAVLARVNPATGLAADADLRRGEALNTETIAGFAPLVAGDVPAALRRRLVDTLTGPRWAGHPGLRWPLPPSISPDAEAFRPRAYWRGPVWPVMNWLLGWALDRCREDSAGTALREAAIAQLGEGSFAEYYDPFTGEALGSPNQSWTAAVALDWLT